MTDLETLKQYINDEELYQKLLEDQEILQELVSPLDMDRVMAGQQSPLFFGSAMTNFGVQLFLDKVRKKYLNTFLRKQFALAHRHLDSPNVTRNEKVLFHGIEAFRSIRYETGRGKGKEGES